MGYLTGILVLVFAVGALGWHRPRLMPSIDWPVEYHYKAEDIDLVTGIIKNIEVWSSHKYNGSRIATADGSNQRYFISGPIDGDYDDFYERGAMYLYHPETEQGDNPIIKCKKLPSFYGDDPADFLPNLYDFEFKGYEEHEGREVSVWEREKYRRRMNQKETLYVSEGNHEENRFSTIGVPVKHIIRKFSETGGLEEHKIVNYYSFEQQVDPTSLEPNTNNCEEWDPYDDYEATIKTLHPAFPHDIYMAFDSYKKHHKRNYVDEEHDYRQAVFNRNWNMVHNHNSKKLGYTLALNHFADKTMDELRFLGGTKYSGDPIRGTHQFPHTVKEVNEMVNELPEHFDLRTEGVITPVRNQANCGSCWAFASAATMEGVLARANGGKLIDLSEQSLIDCAWQYKSHGCEGTEAIDAVYEYILNNGVPTVQEYGPYLEEDGLCKVLNMSKLYHIQGFAAVTPESPNALKAAVYKYGPLTIGVEVTQHMVFYNSGVYYDMECEPGRMNHAVTLVGYGMKNEEPYWIVKNSWGEKWGSDGYILMSAKDDNCNVMNTPVYPIIY